jgi:predicted metal-binding membrane protein
LVLLVAAGVTSFLAFGHGRSPGTAEKDTEVTLDSPPDPAFDLLLPTLKRWTDAPIMLPAKLPNGMENVAIDASLDEGAGSLATVLPALLLVVGGIYQFTPLKRICHVRCSSPLFFLMQNWRSGAPGALRLGVLHGVDCLGCCAGLMVGLVALGLMNLVWMLTAAVIIFAEKTIPGSHRIARPLGVVMVAGGVVLLATSLLGGMAPGMESM